MSLIACFSWERVHVPCGRCEAALAQGQDPTLTFHVVQSVPQHLECGHVEGVAERAVVEVGAGVGLRVEAWDA